MGERYEKRKVDRDEKDAKAYRHLLDTFRTDQRAAWSLLKEAASEGSAGGSFDIAFSPPIGNG